MDPQLESFLEDAFKSVKSTSPEIGRAVVEPDYDVSPDPRERDQLARELVQCIHEHPITADELAMPEGANIEIPGKFPLLRKYIRSITLHRTPTEQPWIEVAPPGNWI